MASEASILMGWQQAGIYLTSRVTTGYDPRANWFDREAERSSALRRSSSPARANHGDGGRGGSGLPVRILPPTALYGRQSLPERVEARSTVIKRVFDLGRLQYQALVAW